MANRLYNKQVTPKGYKIGGKVKGVKEDSRRDQMKQPLKRKAGPKAGRSKPTPSKQRKMGAGEISKRKKPEIIFLSAQKEGPAKRFKTIKEIPINFKKGGVASEAKKKQFKTNQAKQKETTKKAMKIAKGVLNFAVPAVGAAEVGKKIKERMGKKMGGSLKPVQPNQKGLSKLPTEVRNKMGYMKKGGKVHGK